MPWRLGALALAGASLAAVPLYKEGPPPGHPGGFGEPTGRACHSAAGPTDPGGGGELTIAGVPAAYEPGRTYELQVVLRRAGMLGAGFQLAARFAEGEAAGTPAGALTPSDGRTAVVWDTVSHVGYIEHTAAGTALQGDVGRWMVRWTAPAGKTRAVVAFNVAGNAADDDDSPLGDFIYATAVRVAAAHR